MKIKRIIFAFIGCAAFILPENVCSEVITVNPGELATRLKFLPEGTIDLKIEGAMSAADVELFRKLPSSVRTLDLSSLQLEDGSLNDYALFNTKVEKVTLPADLRTIGAWSLAESLIKDLEIPEAVNAIGEGAFYKCANLQKMDLKGTGVKTLPADLFYGCVNLTAVELPSALTSVGDRAFMGSGVVSLKMPSVSEIGEYAMAQMPALVSVEFKSDAKLGTGVFYGDKVLKSLPVLSSDMPALMAAGSGLNMSDNELGSEVIGEGAFEGANATTLVLGGKVKKIDAHAFRNMRNLETVDVMNLGKEVPLTDEMAFSGVDTSKVLLLTAKENVPVWEADPVWGNFKMNKSSNVDDLVTGSVQPEIKIESHGGILQISSTQPIGQLRVYSTDGMVLGNYSPCANTFQCGPWNHETVIVETIVSGIRSINKIRL